MAASSGDGARQGKRGGRRHVYRSGATGCGGGGPVQVDKRTEERPCPYCNRVFKQVGRWQDHVQKKHPQEHQEQQEQEQKEKETSQNRTNQYPQKTPRQFLQDWCQKNKRPTPKYRPREETKPDGNPCWKCKVVLPSSKGAKEDIVKFTQSTYSTKEEAMQRGALVALQQVMGGRSMHMVLPQAYKEEWLELERQARDKDEKEELKKMVQESRKEKEKRHAEFNARQAPQAVVMTEERRRDVEDVLKGLRRHTENHVKEFTSSNNFGKRGKHLVKELVSLGFREVDAQSAVAAMEDRGTLEVEPAIDWICLHANEKHLPPKYAPFGTAGDPVRVLHSAEQDELSQHRDNAEVSYLLSCGYPLAMVEEALDSAKGELLPALSDLYESLTGIAREESSTQEANEAWEEECWVLKSMYGDDMEHCSPGRITITVDYMNDASTSNGDTSVHVDVFCPSSSMYPHDVPILALRSLSLTHGQSLLLTRKLAELSKELVGDVMVFALLDELSQLYFEVKAEHINPSSLLCRQINTTKAVNVSEHTAQKRVPTVSSMPARKDFHRKNSDVENDRLLRWHQQLENSPSHAFMRKSRQSLPAHQQRTAILECISNNAVVVLSGETGCGKSTQVPQFIFEEAITNGAGSTCNIICTQPRRISAIGLASRVSAERAESIGETVGYSVRLEKKMSSRTRLLYCTTGILLRRLLNDSTLRGLTHIIIDEVHERSMDSDLLLLLLRNLLPTRPDLKLVLMSATANADLFARYFNEIPCCQERISTMTIPGFTHPVRDFFVEDIVEAMSDRSSSCFVASSGGNVRGCNRTTASTQKTPASLQGYQQSTVECIKAMTFDSINYEFIESTIAFFCTKEGSAALGNEEGGSSYTGAILVFLPGIAEINRLKMRLTSSSLLADSLGASTNIQVFTLHGAMQSSEQQEVFQKQKKGVRKIVLATNVAETSITIDDVTCVIDSGKHKEMSYDTERGVAMLKETWVSKASARQRRGRAGRVCPGVCLKLYTKSKHDSLEEFQEPEIKRVPLESLCLQVKKILGGSIHHHLALCLSPPSHGAVKQALSNLKTIQGITTNEELTPLGLHLSLLPVDVHIGKMLVYGVLLRCLDPILTIAAALSGHWPFLSTYGRDEEDRRARNQLAGASNQSDHLAVVAAYNGWLQCKGSSKAGRRASREFCDTYLLSEQALIAIQKLRKDLGSMLIDIGLLPELHKNELKNRGFDSEQSSQASLSDFDNVGRVIKAVVCAAFYPNLIRVEHPPTKYKQTQGGSMPEDATPQSIKCFTRDLGRVFLHPCSVNFSSSRFETGWLVYTNMVQTSKTFVRESSMVPPYAILFFGGSIEVRHEQGVLLVDGWAKFRAPARIAVLVRELRAEVDSLLLSKIKSPSLDVSSSPVVQVLLDLLQNNGF